MQGSVTSFIRRRPALRWVKLSMDVQLVLPGFDGLVKEYQVMGVNDRKQDQKDARKAANAQPAPAGDGWKGFVNVELSDAQKPLVKALMSDMPRCWVVVWDLVDAGYKLTISNDATHNSYNVSMTCRNLKDRNMGLTLTGRGGTVEGAVASFVFKHSDILEGDWTATNAHGRRGGGEDFLG